MRSIPLDGWVSSDNGEIIMSYLKNRVCQIIGAAGLGKVSAENIMVNRHRSCSPTGFFVRNAILNELRVDYHCTYTLTEFIKTFKRCGMPEICKRSEIYFPNDRDGQDCRYAGYIGL